MATIDDELIHEGRRLAQGRQAFITCWLTYLPVLLILWVVRDNDVALGIGSLLLWVSVVLMDRAQLNFYRSQSQIGNPQHDEFADRGNYYRHAARADQMLSVIVSWVIWAW